MKLNTPEARSQGIGILVINGFKGVFENTILATSDTWEELARNSVFQNDGCWRIIEVMERNAAYSWAKKRCLEKSCDERGAMGGTIIKDLREWRMFKALAIEEWEDFHRKHEGESFGDWLVLVEVMRA